MDAESALTLRLEGAEADEAAVRALLVVETLDIDGDERMAGVSNDSRALGSSNLVNLPMDGRWMTWPM